MANTKKTTAKASSKKTVKTAKPAAKKATPSKKTVATKKTTPAKKAVKSVAKAAPKKAPVKKTVAAKKPAPVAKKTPAKKAVTLTSAPKKSAMGKGLGALLSSEGIPENKRDSVVELKINDISPNDGQPRKVFDDEALNELASSIKENGVIQPIIVQRKGDGYMIVTGERRWRAARIAELSVIPAIVRDLTNRQVMEQALIENIQREDLNPIEEATAMQELMDSYKLTQELLAKKLGKPRATIANTLRILKLDESLQEFVSRGDLSEGHAKVLLSLKEKEDQRKVADVIMTRDLSVRQAEVLVKKYIEAQENPSAKKAVVEQDIRVALSSKEVETKLKKILGAKVKLKVLDGATGRGRIVIDYKNNEELDKLIEILCGQ
ncbi:chromosome partitioning protein, ParB family [Ruminococcaceae bacterium YAD3003]|nr:chromosome partitioning protein, ParB family [Ruminococcaceae bacterium YAD3003]